jgi:flagellin
MFGLNNVLETGYSAHVIVYSRIKDSLEAISSGENTSDNTASLLIRELLRGEIAGSLQAARNASDGISIVQTFEGAASSINEILATMAELAAKAESGIYSDAQKAVMQKQFTESADEINDIVENTKLNGNKLFSANGRNISISMSNGSTIDIVTKDLTFDTEGLDLTTDSGTVLAFITEKIEETTSYIGDLGRQAEKLAIMSQLTEFDVIHAMGYNANISNMDLATEIAAQTVGQIISESVVLLETQANIQPSRALKLLENSGGSQNAIQEKTTAYELYSFAIRLSGLK